MGVIWEIFVLSPQSCYEPKNALKITLIKKENFVIKCVKVGNIFDQCD